jgi:general stress protein YciG
MGKRRERMETERQQEAYDTGGQSASAAPQPPGPAPAAGITAEDTERLAELGRLHEQGVLTDEEFSAQKARILGTG